ncbi:hypothetical protein Glove_166g3 [Diversispora epigaea]|uniref:Restriction endonuclease domain-containing protein n=1 Tax=Diversispora epigaea TaxID=1348612 RepID=A0A397IVC8_9GLOM|nr:hypothetical protein Glove_166g3 [Diversispora epigaea]
MKSRDFARHAFTCIRLAIYVCVIIQSYLNLISAFFFITSQLSITKSRTLSMKIYSSSSSNFSRISRISKPESSESPTTSTTPITSISSKQSTFITHKPGEELKNLRRLWWEEGNIHPRAKWEEAMLPYMIAEGITLEEYEERTDKFNVRGLWEWVDYNVIIYELPSKHHETFISSVTKEIFKQCIAVDGTNARIGGLGAIRTRADNSEKEADACFRPSKPPVRPPGSDGEGEPWPNIVIEVAYSESEQHVLNKVKEYWLGNLNRVHDTIVIKIDPVSRGQIPKRMQAWHFCVTEKPLGTIDVPHRTYFEFGTHDKYGSPTNIQQGQCVIKISLDCLYHDTFTDVTIHRQLLPDPIILDFLEIRTDFLCMYRTR